MLRCRKAQRMKLNNMKKYWVTFEGNYDYLLITIQLIKVVYVRAFIHQYVIEYEIKLRLQATFTRQ
jgi:hypothetical protein